MFKKILATSVLVTILASTALAQVETMSAPGKSLPVASQSSEEGIPLLNSAPVDPSASMTLSEITVEPETHEAVFLFSTSESTHVIIEYGLMPDYERSISTEPQTDHTETIGELMECATYYYRVHVGDVSREGDFKTLCPKAVIQNTKYKIQKGEAKTKEQAKEVIIGSGKQPTINDKPSTINHQELVLNAAPETIRNAEYEMQNQETVIEEETPEAPSQPVLIAADEMETLSVPNKTPVALIIFAFLSGIVVVFFTFKKDKKWYQK